MALAHSKYRLEVTLVETSSKTTKKTYDLTAVDMATAVSSSATIMTRLLAVTDLKIQAYSIQDVYTDAAVTLPTSAEKENQALITVGISGKPLKSGTLTIPGAKSDVFLAASGENRDIVDTGEAVVQAYVAVFGADELATLSDGEKADPSLGFRGVRRHVKSYGS